MSKPKARPKRLGVVAEVRSLLAEHIAIEEAANRTHSEQLLHAFSSVLAEIKALREELKNDVRVMKADIAELKRSKANGHAAGL